MDDLALEIANHWQKLSFQVEIVLQRKVGRYFEYCNPCWELQMKEAMDAKVASHLVIVFDVMKMIVAVAAVEDVVAEDVAVNLVVENLIVAVVVTDDENDVIVAAVAEDVVAAVVVVEAEEGAFELAYSDWMRVV